MIAGMKEGGQALLGGLDCKVHRNFFGAQINSFEAELPVPQALKAFQSGPQGFRAMFIRAPAVVEAGPSVEVLSEYRWPSGFSIYCPASMAVKLFFWCDCHVTMTATSDRHKMHLWNP